MPARARTTPKSDDMVQVTLAHPLSEQYCAPLGLDPQEYGVGEEIKITRDAAARLVGAGYAAGIDPEDTEAVVGLLGHAAPAPTPITN